MACQQSRGTTSTTQGLPAVHDGCWVRWSDDRFILTPGEHQLNGESITLLI